MENQKELFESPSRRPTWKMWKYQWIGLPLLVLIPLLSLTGVFGLKTDNLKLQKNGLMVDIEFPERMRFGQMEFVQIDVTNSSAQKMKDIKVAFDEKYIEAFDEYEFTPSINDPFEFRIKELKQGQSKSFNVRLKAGEPGTHKGNIRLLLEETELIIGEIKTFIFP